MPKRNAALACATTLRQLNDGITIREAAKHYIMYPEDGGLKEQVRAFEDTPSTFTVLADAFNLTKVKAE